MKVLVSGHRGFIGTRMGKLFNQKKVDWVGYDLLDNQDIRNLFQLDKFFQLNQPNVVIHLAARAGVRNGEEFPDEFISTNITGTNNIVKMCEKYEVNRLIFFSSSSVLGSKNTGIGMSENEDYNPKSVYGITKVTGEYLVGNSSVPSTIIRPFTVYGENSRGDMVMYKWINQIRNHKPVTVYGDGKSERGYTYVGDLVEAIYKLLKINYNGVLHLGGNERIELGELYGFFHKYCMKHNIKHDILAFPMPKEDVMSSFADCSKALEVIGFNPEKRFKKIVNKILKKEL